MAVSTLRDRPLSLPFEAVELAFAEHFFSRRARLYVEPTVGNRPPRSVFAGPLARRVEPDAESVEGGGNVPPIRLALNKLATSQLTFEIDEGDNAPLTLLGADGVVRVPRLSFKAEPGQYRLLLDNDDALPPRYDLAALRQEVLAYSAVGLTAGPAEPNRAYRRFAFEYFENTPSTFLLWGTLIVAVVALLFLTVRILRQPPA
jgi:hypothetical protein